MSNLSHLASLGKEDYCKKAQNCVQTETTLCQYTLEDKTRQDKTRQDKTPDYGFLTSPFVNSFSKILSDPSGKFKIKHLFVVLLLLALIGAGFLITRRAEATTICWSGGGADNNWGTTGNWKGGVAPVTSDIAEFDSTTDCPVGTYPNANKNATIDSSISVAGMNIKTYTGTISQGSGNTVTVGASNYSQTAAGSTFTGGNAAITINGSYSLTAGTFTSTSGTLTVTGAWTISGSPTFTHNSGTVLFQPTGANVTYACNNATFNVVTLDTSQVTANYSMTINSDCSFPLGASPTINGHATNAPTINLNGTLSSSGTLNIGSVTNTTLKFVLNATTYSLSGFTELVFPSCSNTNTSLILSNSANFNANNFSTFTPCNITINSSGSTFTAPTGTFTLQGSLSVVGGTFTPGAVTVFQPQGNVSTSYSCNNATFNSAHSVTLDFSNTWNGVRYSNMTINSNCNLYLGTNPTVISPTNSNAIPSIILNGTLTGSGTLNLCNESTYRCSIQLNSTTYSLSGFSGLQTQVNTTFGTLRLSNNANFDASSYTTFNIGYLTIDTGSTFTAPYAGMTEATSLTNNGTFNAHGTITFGPQVVNFTNNGTFNANTGTVKMDMANSAPTLSGSTTFNNLSFINVPNNNRTITFTAGTTQTVNNAFIITGKDSSNKVKLRSSSAGTQYYLSVNGPADIKWADIQDSNACGWHTLIANASTNSGNNSCWDFAPTSATSNPIYILRGTKIKAGVKIWKQH